MSNLRPTRERCHHPFYSTIKVAKLRWYRRWFWPLMRVPVICWPIAWTADLLDRMLDRREYLP